MTDPNKLSSTEETLNAANQEAFDSVTDVTELKTKIGKLATLDPLEYDLERKRAAKQMGVQVKTLDTQVKTAKREITIQDSEFFETVIPYSEPVSPAELFNELYQTILAHIILDSAQAYALVLWIVMTWLMDGFEVAPLAIINAPEKSCGKSQLLDIISRLCAKPLVSANMTTASLFRVNEMYGPTLLIDEADMFLKENMELKGLINAGHTRSSSYVIRITGDNHEPKKFGVFGPKVVAGISLEKHLSDSTMSRGIVINMRRKLECEKVTRLRHSNTEQFAQLKAKLARFTLDYAEQIHLARPELPEALSDRAQDNWEPLIAIAETAGNVWLDYALNAALNLSSSEEASLSIGTELLLDIQALFDTDAFEKISSADLIKKLIDDEERPWATYNRGRPITPRQVASLLKTYGIHSKTVRMSYNKTPKGYEFGQFKDAFSRYLDKNQSEAVAVHDSQSDVFKATAESFDDADCGAVADVAANTRLVAQLNTDDDF